MKKNPLRYALLLFSGVFFPFVAFAQSGPCAGSGIQAAFCTFSRILNSLIPVIIALGVVYLVWGIVQYFIADAEEAKKNGRTRIVYGLIALAVTVSVWGLVNILIRTLGIAGGSATPIPAGGTAGCTIISRTFAGILNFVTCTINDAVIPLIFALALAGFVWGVVQFFIIGANEESKREQGKKFMIWGLIFLTAMVSVWGLVRILGDTFGIDTSAIPKTKENDNKRK